MADSLEHLRVPILLAAVVANGLQAGTYHTWASGVMPGLARTDDRTFVSTMQHANAAIVNPVFLATFLGAPALAALGVAATSGAARPWAVAGLALAAATVVVTVVGNVPLNDALAAAGDADPTAARTAFEDSWVRWNVVRTATSTGALGVLGWALSR